MELKGRCINFELWYTDDVDQDLKSITLTLEYLIKKDIDQAVNSGCNTVIGLLLYEGFLYKNNKMFYDLLGRIYYYGVNKGIIKFILICGIAWDYQNELKKRNLNYEIVSFDYSANAMWQSYKSYTLPNWNKNTDRYLFLGGVPSRTNRILLLSKFYDEGLLNLDQAEWSFFSPYTVNDQNICRQLLNHYTDEQYQIFLEYAERKVDDKYFDTKEYSRASGADWKRKNFLSSDFFKDPNYIDLTIFQSTTISVISEGYVFLPANDCKFLTEKTWRAVINRHPFILADNSQRKEFAKKLGLEIFDDFFNFKYDDHKNLDGVVKNIKNFIQIKNEHSDKILEKVEHNFRLFFQIINNNELVLNKLTANFNLEEKELSYWFRQKSFDHLFRLPKPINKNEIL